VFLRGGGENHRSVTPHPEAFVPSSVSSTPVGAIDRASEETVTENVVNGSTRPVLAITFVFLAAVTVQVLLTAAGAIPYIGDLFESLRPVLAFIIFVGIGFLGRSIAEHFTPTKRAAFFAVIALGCAITFASPYVIGYYTWPLKVGRAVEAERHVQITYAEAATAAKSFLRQETGSDGVTAYALYTERVHLSAKSFGEFTAHQFEEVEGIESLLGAVINVILHAIPMLLKLIFCDKLMWITEAGMLGIIFWYLIAVTLAYFGYKTS
jgi:hypothetical protein